MTSLTQTDYKKLVRDIGGIYEDARKALVGAWWRIGRRIVEVEQAGSAKAPFGSGLLERLSLDLTREYGRGFSYTNLKNMRRVYLASPNRQPAGDLTVAQRVELLSVPDPKKRHLLEKRVLRQGLSRNQVRELVHAETSKEPPKPVEPFNPPKLLTPARGKLYTHRIVLKGGGLYIDLGFRNYRRLSPAQAGRFEEGDIVEMLSNSWLRKLSGASVKDLYTYEAELDRVSDADTQWYFIFTSRQEAADMRNDKLRLRGIDSRELAAASGKAAKAFVQDLFKRAVKLTVTTTKPDKFDRYLSDIFLTLEDGTEIFLNNELLKKGYARRYEDPKPEDWDE